MFENRVCRCLYRFLGFVLHLGTLKFVFFNWFEVVKISGGRAIRNLVVVLTSSVLK